MDALAFAAVAVASAAVARYRSTAPLPRYVCSTGDDCACHTAERTRPPRAPKQLKPLPIDVKEGDELWFCACGQSKTFPYCDGSHRAYNAANGTSFAPIKWTATETKTIYACACGHSGKRPLCDGTHRKVREVLGAAPAAPAATGGSDVGSAV